MADDGKEEEKVKIDIENDGDNEDSNSSLSEQDVVLAVAELQFSYKQLLDEGNKEEADKIWKKLLAIYEENSLELLFVLFCCFFFCMCIV